jgi:ABC-type bacteriocin/lantibiotic exporter with double-glycine peptidase domain
MMLAIANAVTSFITYISFAVIGDKAIRELKWRYLKAILTKEMEWFDQQNVNELPSGVFTNLTEIENALGSEISFIITAFTACISSVGYSFY